MSKSSLRIIYNVIQCENKIDNDFLCTICNKIMIDAHNAPCGCRYCLECITKYLYGQRKYCPGNMNDCKNDLLSINDNVRIDLRMNIKIAKLTVKCPQKDCNDKIELGKLEDHKICNSQSVNCPFVNLGCVNVNLTNNKIGEHLLAYNLEHSKLLIEHIYLMSNKMDSLENEVKELKENQRMNDKLRSVEDQIQNIVTTMHNYELTNNKLQAVIENQHHDINHLNEDMVGANKANRLLEDRIKDLGTQILNYQSKNDKLRGVIEHQSGDIDKFKAELDALRTVNHSITYKMKDFTTKLDTSEKIKLARENEAETCSEKIDKLQRKVSDIATQQEKLNFGQFVWKIENFSEKRKRAASGKEKAIESLPFYTHKNGYKMCLSVYPNGDSDGEGEHLAVYFYIMRSPYDDILQWPFKYDVTIAIIDQETGLEYESDTVKYTDFPNTTSWDKPTKDRNNIASGFPEFLTLEELTTNPALCGNDQIFIKCTVQQC